MATRVDALNIRRTMGREKWLAPIPFGPDGWMFRTRDNDGTMIVTVANYDGADWVHASISYRNRMPEYADMVRLHTAVFPHGWSYEVFAPSEHHINIAEHARHLWGLLDGSPAMPNFGENGTI